MKSSLKQSDAITNPLWKKKTNNLLHHILRPEHVKMENYFYYKSATSGSPLGGNGVECILLGPW